MINANGLVKKVENVGDVVQSLEVYKNKLFVIVNSLPEFWQLSCPGGKRAKKTKKQNKFLKKNGEKKGRNSGRD